MTAPTSRPLIVIQGPLGVPVQIHHSIALLLMMGLPALSAGQGVGMILTIVLGLIGSIYLHELGHAWGARVQGVPVHRIILFGGGGLCAFDARATPRQQELIIVMGPLTNLALWAVISLGAGLVDERVLRQGLTTLATLNLFLALFNMLPVFPLDGGRLLNLILQRVIPGWARRLSGGIGVVLAVLWIPGMLLMLGTFGIVLFFLPSIRLHWHMLRGR